jgi:multifunctional methyltransferase subunit TRM112
MRLFTHNFLQCHVRNCTKDNFPLALTDAEMEVREAEYNEEFMRNYLSKLDYPALKTTVASV